MGLFFVLVDLAHSAILLVIAWRFFVGALPSVWAPFWLQSHLGNASWAWFVSVPVLLAGLALAAFWQWSHERGR